MKDKRVLDCDKYYRKLVNFDYLREWKYQITQEIGRGGYGVVYKAFDTVHEDAVYACKINFATVSRQIVYAQIGFLELTRQKKRFPTLANIILKDEKVHIFLEYFPHRPFITFFASMTMNDAKHYLLQLLLGLKQLKQLGIYHRDIKPGNFLFNPESKKGKIVDFGLAELDPNFLRQFSDRLQSLRTTRMKNQSRQEFKKVQQFNDYMVQKARVYQKLQYSLANSGVNKIGTENYMPLESLLRHKEQSYSSDIWPVGVIMLQIFLKKYVLFNPISLPTCKKEGENPFIPVFIIQLCTLFGQQSVIAMCKQLGYQLQLPQGIQKINLKKEIQIDNYNQEAEDLLLRILDINYKTRIQVEDAIRHSFFDSVRDQHEI